MNGRRKDTKRNMPLRSSRRPLWRHVCPRAVVLSRICPKSRTRRVPRRRSSAAISSPTTRHFRSGPPEAVDDAKAALAARRRADVPLGLYLHIPFCRKRCHFCYFRVYTDKNAREVEDYLDAAGAGMGALRRDARARRPAAATSSISAAGRRRSCRRGSSRRLVQPADGRASWTEAEEVTFECEPGTLTEPSSRRSARSASRGSASASRTSTTGSSS